MCDSRVNYKDTQLVTVFKHQHVCWRKALMKHYCDKRLMFAKTMITNLKEYLIISAELLK